MRQILRATDNYARKLSRETGLTASQLLLLQVLDEHGETTAGQIAAHMGITQATTTALLQKLETSGMIQRRRGEKDRRQVLLSLTDKGQKVLAIAPDGVHAQFHKQFSDLKEWEQIMLIAALERVADMLDGDHPDAAAVIDHMAELAGEVPYEPEQP